MSRLFRVFVSSSFLDMAQERRALTEGVFEPLGEFCAARGASFQAVDLRWGISPEAVLEQQTMPTCLAEVRRCVQASPHLNFLALIGDRRGWLPAPAAIPAAEFALLAGAVSPAERDLLDDWYRVDQNAVPSVWRLRARRDVAEDDWTQIERGLREALERVAHHLPQHRRLAYLGSAVEQEIAEGVLTVNDPTGAFAVVRSRVSRDDTDARHLDALEVALRERLPADRILTSRAGDDRHELVEAIRTRFTAVIESVLDDERVTPHPRAVTQVHHNLARRQRAAGAPETDAPLVGRDAETKALVRFARTPGHGMIGLVGTAGAGKSALVAAVADQAAERIPAGGPLVILRLLGTTAATSRLDGLLRGLVDEIAAGLEISAPQAADVPELIGRLAELLAQARAARPILLFLDAVDQLAADHGAHRLVWLPDPLPPHVRVVVSTLPGPTEDALCARTSTATIPLAGLGAEEGRFLLGRWLSAAGRRLTEEQERAVVDAFAVQGNPLWLRLTFEQARRWRSDDAPPALPEDLPGLVRMLLASLTDTAHGPTLVAHALALLAASGHGLSELDILSALSSDPAVMAEVRARTHERWRADISTVPVVLWAQLRADLAPFLTERVVDGDVLHDFYHRVLRDAAARDGLQPPVGAARHRQLAALFARTADPDGTRSWRGASPRALEQVPAQLRAAEAWTELARVLVDVRFVEATASLVARSLGIDGRGRSVVRYGGVHAIRAGLNELLAASPPDVDAVDRAVCSALQRALALEADLLTVQPELLWQQLANRMRWESSPAVAALLDREEARRAAEGGPAWLRLRRPVGRTPGLVHILRERGRAHCCAVSPDGAVLISGGDEDGTLWDAGTGSWLANLPGHSGPVHACAAARDALYTADEAGTLRRWSWDGVRATLVQSGRVGETTFARARSGVRTPWSQAPTVSGSAHATPSRSWLCWTRVHTSRAARSTSGAKSPLPATSTAPYACGDGVCPSPGEGTDTSVRSTAVRWPRRAMSC
ncbi:hypothetical protein GCM10009613_15260 [Pseudonocardia kongjuensis]|uniref:NACHT domain-containing protein n=1 Tax=Pseudonocardia kongjuensis TaxID=102227 RepID=A0ABP4IC61_9PSEU